MQVGGPRGASERAARPRRLCGQSTRGRGEKGKGGAASGPGTTAGQRSPAPLGVPASRRPPPPSPEQLCTAHPPPCTPRSPTPAVEGEEGEASPTLPRPHPGGVRDRAHRGHPRRCHLCAELPARDAPPLSRARHARTPPLRDRGHGARPPPTHPQPAGTGRDKCPAQEEEKGEPVHESPRARARATPGEPPYLP